MRPSPAWLIVGLVACSACSRPPAVASTPTPAVPPDAPDNPTPPTDPSPPPVPPGVAECDRVPTADEIAATATAPFADVLVQLDAQSGAVVNIRPTIGTPFSRVPELTLLRDGTTVRATASGIVTAKLSAAEVSAFVEHLGQLGAGNLTSHLGRCSCLAPGKISFVCLDDGDTTILRVAVEGKLRHVMVYGDFWNDAAAAHAVLDEIRRLRPRAEKPYVPKAATLVFLTLPPEAAPPKCAPLATGLTRAFERPEHGYFIWTRAVEGKELGGLAKALGSEHGVVCVGQQAYTAALYPWLPGIDHHAAIAAWQERAATLGSE